MQGSSAHGSSPSQSPTHTSYQVQSTYFPSEQPESHYVQQQQPDDDPFNLRGSDNPFANTVSGQSEVVAVPDHSTVTINTGERQANVVLQFQGVVAMLFGIVWSPKVAVTQSTSPHSVADSQLPTHGTTGKMGDQVPRGSFCIANQQMLSNGIGLGLSKQNQKAIFGLLLPGQKDASCHSLYDTCSWVLH